MSITTTQETTFRHQEVERIFSLARAGESASIVGISGIGKSNLFHHMADPQIQKLYLGEEYKKYIFVTVNFNFIPDSSARSVYSLILEQFELSESLSKGTELSTEVINQITTHHNDLLNTDPADKLKIQRFFKLALRPVMADPEKRLVFLFDQFDKIYQDGSVQLFTNLRAIREAYKYRISYFVFTRTTLPNLASSDEVHEEFYELLASNIWGLKPYNEQDAWTLLQRISKRYSVLLEEALGKKLLALTGQHAGLLRATYLFVLLEKVDLSNTQKKVETIFLNSDAVINECNKIWNSIGVEEQRFLYRHAHGLSNEESENTQKELVLKGLLNETEEIFSSLFEFYVRERETPWENSLYLDEQTRKVLVFGKPTESLSALEFRLFKLLYERADDIVDKDELVNAGWPEAKGGVFDQTIASIIYRLRKKINPEGTNNVDFIESFRSQGYRLNLT